MISELKKLLKRADIPDDVMDVIRNTVETHEELKDELERNRSHAAEARTLKSDLISVLSHELRTPLTSILGYSDLILSSDKDELDTEIRDFCERIEYNGKRLQKLLKNLLNISKIDSDSVKMNTIHFSPKATIDGILSSYESQIENKNIEIIKQYEQASHILNSDQEKLESIITNILDNSIRLTDNGTITISTMFEDDWFHCNISDTGSGVPQERLDKLFAPASKESSDNIRYEGVGLNLAMAKKTIDVIAGVIEISSEQGKGTDFKFKIPRDVTHDLPTAKIIVCEDHKGLAKVYKKLISFAGYTVDVVADGRTAFHQIAEQNDYDLLITDLKMSDWDGIETITALEVTNPSLKIIVVSSHLRDNYYKNQLKSFESVKATISKPFENKNLLSLITKTLSS